MLLIVGRQDTGDLEAQIRGSRHAWDIRIISVDALLRLMSTKEEVEDPQIVHRIHDILIPREFTRLDEIADVLFSATEDIKQDSVPSEDESDSIEKKHKEPKFTPVAFHDACMSRVQDFLRATLIKRTRAGYSSPDKKLAVNCCVSKEHHPESAPGYWFAFHPHQQEFLSSASKAYVAFGCGSSKRTILIPFLEFENWLEGMNKTESNDRFYWHVIIHREGEKYTLRRKKGVKIINLTEYVLPSQV